MDLNNFDTSDAGAATLILRTPGGRKLIDEESGEPVSIDLLGVDSPQATELRRKQQARRLKHGLGRRGLRLSSDELEADALEILMACTTGWKNIIVEGVRLECNPDNVRKVYTRFPFIREQVDEFIEDRENYLGN